MTKPVKRERPKATFEMVPARGGARALATELADLLTTKGAGPRWTMADAVTRALTNELERVRKDDAIPSAEVQRGATP